MRMPLSPTENPGSAHVYLLFVFSANLTTFIKTIQIEKKSTNFQLPRTKRYHFLRLPNKNKIKKTTGTKANVQYVQCDLALFYIIESGWRIWGTILIFPNNKQYNLFPWPNQVVSTTKKNCNVILVLEFLHKIVKVTTFYSTKCFLSRGRLFAGTRWTAVS